MLVCFLNYYKNIWTMSNYAPLGIFDSGYGGLTIFKEIEKALPQYDLLYFGDNARVPYGNRSFETIYKFTWQCVQQMFELNCPLVILACNTASAKALRNIQQLDLPKLEKKRNVLGVIRPTTELVGSYSDSKHIGVLATKGTVNSESYVIEIKKFYPEANVFQVACPLWVPIIENNEHLNSGADYFVKKYINELLEKSDKIDTIILACTHYPLLIEKIREALPKGIKVLSQGEIVAKSLIDYLERHKEFDDHLSKNGQRAFYTTDDTIEFNSKAELFLGRTLESEKIVLSY
jgi:glutamate racemase